MVSIHRIPDQQAIHRLACDGIDLSLTRTDRKVLQGPPRPQGADTRGAARREIGVNHQSHPRPFEPQVSALSSRASSLAVHSLQSRLGSPAITVAHLITADSLPWIDPTEAIGLRGVHSEIYTPRSSYYIIS